MQLVEIFQVRLDERKIHVVDALKKYKDDPSIYITFSNVAKVGINPQSDFDTPLGIYAYPLNAVWDNVMFDNLPFGTERSFVHVLRASGDILDLRKYDDGDLERDLEALREIFFNGKFAQKRAVIVKDKIMKKWLANNEAEGDNSETPEQIEQKVDDFMIKQKNQMWRLKIEQGKNSALVGTPGGRIWNITRLLALFFRDGFSNGIDPRSGGKAPVIWNALFRQLGYAGAVDRYDEGIIHSNEPTQAVFFSKSAVKHVETITNIRERPHDNEQQITMSSFWDMMNWADGLHDFDDETSAKHKEDVRWISLLKTQWAQLMQTGKSQNFVLGETPKAFEKEMLEIPRAFVKKMLRTSDTFIPIVVSTIMKHPEMQTEEVWRTFIAHFNTTKSKLLKFLLMPAVISLHAKIHDMSYDSAWKLLSEKVMHDLFYTQKLIDLVMEFKYASGRNPTASRIAEKSAMDYAKTLIKPLKRYLDPETCNDEALTSSLKYIEMSNELPF